MIIATPGRLVDHLAAAARPGSTTSRCWCSTRPTGCSTWASSPSSTQILQRLPQGAPDAALLGHHGRRGGRVRRHAPQGPGAGRGGAQRHHRGPRRAAGLPGARRRRRCRCCSRCSPRTSQSTLVFTRTKRRADRVWKARRAGRPQGGAHPRRPLPGAAAAGARRLQGRHLPGAGGHRHRRPRHRRGGDRPRGELRPAPRRRGLRPPRRPHRARRGERTGLGLLLPRGDVAAARHREAHPQGAARAPRSRAARRSSRPRRRAPPRGAPTRACLRTAARERAVRAVDRSRRASAEPDTATGTTGAPTPLVKSRRARRPRARRGRRPRSDPGSPSGASGRGRPIATAPRACRRSRGVPVARCARRSRDRWAARRSRAPSARSAVARLNGSARDTSTE